MGGAHGTENKKGVVNDERYYPGRRRRHPTLPADDGHLQAAAARLRQADDLLPAVHPDAGRHPGHPDHLHPHRHPDNIFYGAGFSKRLKNAAANAANGRSTVFGYYVNDPERFGVVAFDKDGHATDIEEKPANPKSNYAVTGLYFYNSDVVKMAKQVKPSARGELEITTLNQMYLDQGKLDVQLLGRGYAWLDTGTMDSLVEAATFVQTVEQRQGIKISAPEEIAYKYGWITKEKLLESAARYGKSPYGQHLKNVADDKLQY